MRTALHDTASLAASTTYHASLQTYFTIRLLADRDRADDAYRAYAYFRWVDDWIDRENRSAAERTAFLDRQASLVDGCYRGSLPFKTTAEEEMLVDLVRSDPSPNSGLAAYIRNLMGVMVFDCGRRGRLISQAELNNYSLSLSIAITEAIHYFIGHGQSSPHDSTRYLAVSAAHIAHMLRDTCEDIEAGYFNMPAEMLELRNDSAVLIDGCALREWVRGRAELARSSFKAARGFIGQVENARCRLAYFAYIARFETVLDMIEADGWRLRPAYKERKSPINALRMAWSILLSSLDGRAERTGATVLGPR